MIKAEEAEAGSKMLFGAGIDLPRPALQLGGSQLQVQVGEQRRKRRSVKQLVDSARPSSMHLTMSTSTSILNLSK